MENIKKRKKKERIPLASVLSIMILGCDEIDTFSVFFYIIIKSHN